MEFNEQIEPTILKNTVNFLHKASDKLPRSLNILKSFYASKCRILEVRGNVYLPWSRNKSYERCFRCCLPLNEGSTTFSVDPEKKRSKFAQKLLKKLRKKDQMTRFQTRYAKKLSFFHQNCLKITCNLCQNVSKHKLIKPLRKQQNIEIESHPKKKSKKKKDKFCGLNSNSVVAAQSEINSTEKTDEASKAQGFNKFNQQRDARKVIMKKKQKTNQLNQLLAKNDNAGKKGSKTTNLSAFLESL